MRQFIAAQGRCFKEERNAGTNDSDDDTDNENEADFFVRNFLFLTICK